MECKILFSLSKILIIHAYIYAHSATFYAQNGLPGACGVFHSDQDLIGAISKYIISQKPGII